MQTKQNRVAALLLMMGAGAGFGQPATVETTTNDPSPSVESEITEVEVQPIQCWWRTDRAAVRVGERFSVILTCGVIETDDLRVVADLGALEPASVALLPFEVVGGSSSEDVVDSPWRHFQRRYEVRLIAADLFGQDVEIPGLEVGYNIQSSAGGGTEGRDRTYLLPGLPMRILSLAPQSATDIRDTLPVTFEDVESRRFRASALRLFAWILLALGAIILGVALIAVLRRLRVRTPVDHRVSPVGLMGGCLQEIANLEAQVERDGWTAAALDRGLSIYRVIGALAMGRPVTQTSTSSSAATTRRQGQIELRSGPLGRRRLTASAATTSLHIVEALEGNPVQGRSKPVAGVSRDALEELGGALTTLSSARYQRAVATSDAVATGDAVAHLDLRLENAAALLRTMRRAHLSAKLSPVAILRARNAKREESEQAA